MVATVRGNVAAVEILDNERGRPFTARAGDAGRARLPVALLAIAPIFVPRLTRGTEVVYDGDDGPNAAGLTLLDAGARRERREAVAGRVSSPEGGRA